MKKCTLLLHEVMELADWLRNGNVDLLKEVVSATKMLDIISS